MSWRAMNEVWRQIFEGRIELAKIGEIRRTLGARLWARTKRPVVRYGDDQRRHHDG